ncbi:MAG: NAD-dependent epimerase/dehydratase family protein, partial [Phycisphaerae bacterium]
ASGARIMVTLLHALKARGLKRGLATLAERKETVILARQQLDRLLPAFDAATLLMLLGRYGDAARLPVAEASAPRPRSPYAEAKLAAEETCAAAADAGQLAAVCLRFFNVYGPRQDPGSEYSGVISRFMAAAKSSKITFGRPVMSQCP